MSNEEQIEYQQRMDEYEHAGVEWQQRELRKKGFNAPIHHICACSKCCAECRAEAEAER